MNLLHVDLATLHLLVIAAETLNLTQASIKANMTVSTASKRLAELERITDCTLFVRLPRGIELTAAGKGIADHARYILECVNRMACDANDFAVGVRGHVRLTANTSAVIQFLPHDLASYLADNSSVRISTEEALSDEIVEALRTGRADIGIFADNVASDQITKRVYRHDELVLLVPADHPLTNRKALSISEALDNDFVALNQGSSLLRRLADAAAANSKMLKVRMQVSSFDGICRMIEAGLGIGVLPRGSVRKELLGVSLEAIALTDDWAKRTLYVGIAGDVGLSPEARKLYNFLAGIE